MTHLYASIGRRSCDQLTTIECPSTREGEEGVKGDCEEGEMREEAGGESTEWTRCFSQT